MAPVRLEIAGALLARGQYRSIGSKNSAIKCAHVSAQEVWTDLHIQVASDAIRAGCRGRGPDRQAASLLSEELIDKMAEHRLHAHDLWPEEPVAVLVVVCAWLDREIESSSAVVEHVCVHEPQEGQAGCGWAEWKLLATKTDVAAQGTTRTLGCACPSPLCPVAAMRKVLGAAQRRGGGAGSPLLAAFRRSSSLHFIQRGDQTVRFERTLFDRSLPQGHRSMWMALAMVLGSSSCLVVGT